MSFDLSNLPEGDFPIFHGKSENEIKSTLKVYFRKNLKMSPQKLAAQVGHVSANIAIQRGIVTDKIVVLQLSDTKFNELKHNADYIQVDNGLTEVKAGTETAFGIIEEIYESL